MSWPHSSPTYMPIFYISTDLSLLYEMTINPSAAVGIITCACWQSRQTYRAHAEEGYSIKCTTNHFRFYPPWFIHTCLYACRWLCRKRESSLKNKIQSQKFDRTIFMQACEKIEWLLKHKAPINNSPWYETRWSCNVNAFTMYCIFYNVAIIWCLTESRILYDNRKIGITELWTMGDFYAFFLFVDGKSGKLYKAIMKKVRNNISWKLWNKLSSGLTVRLIFSLIPSPCILFRRKSLLLLTKRSSF